MTRHWPAALLASAACLLAAAPASHAAPLDRSAAAKKALAALDARQGDDPLIVFGLRRTVAAGTRVTQAGPGGAAVRKRGSRTTRRLARAGVDAIAAGRVMTANEASWLFFADEGPNLAFEHPGHVVLVGRQSGKVRVSKQLRWVPLVNGRVPAFFASPRNYASKRYRVLDRPWKQARAAKARAKAAANSPAVSAAQQRLADALAAERSCALRVSDTLGDFYDFGRVDETRASLGRILNRLSRLNAGFVSRRYTAGAGRTAIQSAQALIDDGCRDLFLYVAGSATKSGPAAIVVGVRPRGAGAIQWQTLTAESVEDLIAANRDVTFKLAFDAPYAGRIAARLADESNVSVLLTTGDADDPSFTYLPQILGGSGVVRNPSNPFRLLEFTNGIIGGLQQFVALPDEIDHAIGEQAAGRTDSVMAWMLARALDLGPSPFSAMLLGRPNQRVPFTSSSRTPPPAGPANRPPNPTTPGTIVTAEDTNRNFTLTATDPDGDPVSFAVTATPLHGALTGTAPNLTYDPAQDFNGDDQLTYTVTDNRGASATHTITLRTTPDNDSAAVIGGPVLTPTAYIEQDPGVVVDNGLTVTDVDSTSLVSATVEVVSGFVNGDKLNFVDQLGITGTYNSGTGVLTLTGTASLADYQAALRSVEFESSSDDPGPTRTIRFRGFDGDEIGVPADRAIAVTEVNDAPVNTVPGAQSTNEDTTLTLTDAFSVSDPDVQSDPLQVTLTGTNGTLTLTDLSGLTFGAGDGTNDATMTFTGTPDDVNDAIDGVQFIPAANYNGSGGQIQLVANDQGNNGTGGALSDTDNVAVTVTAVNDAPVNSLPTAGALNTNEDTESSSAAFSFTDVDALSSDAMEVDLSVLNGTLDVAAGGTLSGDGTDTVTVTGTKANILTSLASVKYTPDANFNGGDTLTMVTSDLGNTPAPAATDTDNFTIAVAAVNDAPVLTVPAAPTTNEDVPLAFTGGNAISVADLDAGAQNVDVDVSIPAGALTVDTLTLPIGITMTGNGTGALSLTGTLSDIDAALDTLVWAPATNDGSDRTLSVTASDLGNTGSGGALTDIENVLIDVTPVNDNPVVGGTGGTTVFTEGGSPVAVAGGLALSDVESDTISGATAQIVSGYANDASPADHDVLTCTPASGITCASYDTSTGTLTLTGTTTLANYQSVLRSVTFSNDSESSSASTRTVRFTVTDTGSAPANGTSDQNVSVTRVNDAPVHDVLGAQTTNEDTPKALALGVGDVDAGTSPLQTTVTVTSGVATLGSLSGLTFTTGDGTNDAAMTFTGTQSAIDTALGGLSYVPTPDYSGPASVQLVTSDQGATGTGGAQSDDDTTAITVDAVNDAPTVNTSDDDATFIELGAAVAADPGIVVADVDDTNLESATVSITDGAQGADSLALPSPPSGVTAIFASGTLTITGTKTVAEYETMLRAVEFDSTSASPGPTREITFAVNDGTDASPATNDTRDIAIANTNDAPAIGSLGGTVIYNENAAATQLDGDATVTDLDSANLVGGTVTIAGGTFRTLDELTFTDQGAVQGTYNSGTGVLTITGTGTTAQYQAFVRSVGFRTTDDTPEVHDRSVEFQVDDGEPTTNLSTVAIKTVDVNATNDPPVVTAGGGNPSYTEDASPTVVDSGVTVTDADHTALASAAVAIANLQSGDVLHFTDTLEIDGTYAAGTLTLLPQSGQTPTVAQFQAALRSVAFSNSTQNPSTTDRTINFSASDGIDSSNTASTTMDVVAVNDSPALTQPNGAALTYTEDSPTENHQLAIAPALTATDGDDPNLDGATVQFTAGFVAAEDELVFVNQSGISGVYNTGTGVLTLTGSASIADYQTALRSVAYANDSDNPDTTQRTVSYQVTDGHTGQSPLSNTVTRNIDVVRTNDNPTADNESFLNAAGKGAIGNTALVVDDNTDPAPTLNHPKKSVTGDLLDGDTDPDGPNALSIQPGTFTTADGGKVTLEADGDFTYVSDPADDCTNPQDTFTYTVTDGHTPTAGTATGTVTVDIAGCAWYVDNDPAKTGNAGTSTEPFDTLAQAESESATNHTVFVFDDDNSSAGLNTGYAMAAGERLIGEHEGLSVDPDQGGPLPSETLHPANENARPTLTTTAAENVIELAADNEIRGIAIDPQGASSGITGLAGDINGRIDDVKIVDTGTAGTEPALELSGTTGGTGYTISDLTIDTTGASTTPPATAKGIVLNGAGVVNFQSAGTISLKTRGAAALDVDTTSLGAGSVFDEIAVTDSGSGGVRLFNLSSGSVTQLGDGSGADLSLTTTSGSTAALLISSARTVSVPSGGTANISATGGPAMSVSGSTIPALDLDTVSSSGSTSHGISLSGLGTGTFSASGGTLALDAAATGPACAVDGGSGNVTFPGTINNGGGGSVSVLNRGGGTVTMSGPINDSNDPGGGIVVSSASGGSTVFSNAGSAAKNLHTGSSTAVTFSGSNNHTLSFTGGGLNIDTTSGHGLQAQGIGVGARNTLNVTGSSNTIDTTSGGKALEASLLDVGAAPLTFQSINSSGANAGILLNDTGANDALTVTGTASVNPCTNADQSGCTGGALMNTTGADSALSTPPGTAVVLKDTKGVSLNRMRVANNSNYGIRGTNVTGFSLTNSVVHGTNGTNNSTGIDDSSARFDNLLGTVSITDTEMSGGYNSNLMVENTSGTLNATLNAFKSGALNSTGGDDAVNFLGRTTSTVNVTVQSSAISQAGGDLFQYLGDGSGGGTLNFTGNTLTNNEPTPSNGGGGVTIHGGARGTATLNVQNNTFRDAPFSAVTMGKSFESGQTGTANATFNNNTIGVTGVPNSGANGGSGLVVDHLGAGNLTATITNNNIRQYNSMGMRITVGGGIASSGQANFNISNNILAEPGSNPSVTLFNGLRVTSGVASGDNFQTCVNFGANSITGSSDGPTEDFRLAADHSSIRLPTYGGAFNGDAAVVAFVQSKIGGGAQGTAVSGANGTSTAIGSPATAGWTGTGSTCP